VNRTADAADNGRSTPNSHSIFTTISSLLQTSRATFVYKFKKERRLRASKRADEQDDEFVEDVDRNDSGHGDWLPHRSGFSGIWNRCVHQVFALLGSNLALG
jgi:hypothetical protein